MTGAWVGDRDASFDSATEAIATLLSSCRNPVFTVASDVDGARAALDLARLVGACVDHGGGAALDAEIALLAETGGFFTSPGEARRRADVLVAVGPIPQAHAAFAAELASAPPDLSAAHSRALFSLGQADEAARAFGAGGAATAVGAPGLPLSETLAALRASLAGRPAAVALTNIDALRAALAEAAYAVFLCGGMAGEPLALPMLQGLIGDLSATRRAAALMLTASEAGFAAAQVAAWKTGATLPLGFDGELALFEPLTFDGERAIAEGRADLHVSIGAVPQVVSTSGKTVVIAPGQERAASGAAVTVSTAAAGVERDGTVWSARAGTFATVIAQRAGHAPPVAEVMQAIIARLCDREAAA